MRIASEIKDYIKQKAKDSLRIYESPQFWITAGQVGMILTLLQGKTELFLLNIIITLGGYFLMDFKKGKWRGDMRKEYKEKAIEQTGVNNGNQAK